MTIEREKDASAHASSGSNRSALKDECTRNAHLDKANKSKDQNAETLGVLLVHGIGSQRRGDTLVHCTTALHSWMRDWRARGRHDYPLKVDLVDTSVAEAGPDHPAQARIIFRRGNDVSTFSWIIAESCWFDTYRRPDFYEFMRWALLILPIAIIVHFMPRHRRLWRALEAWLSAMSTGRLTEHDYYAIKRQLGPIGADKRPEDLVKARFMSTYGGTLLWQLVVMQIQLTLAGLAGLVVQVLLIAVGVLTILPGITRSVAGWVQRKISGTIGDSYMFVTSPVTVAAIITRVKKDLDWLAAHSDRVIVLAHSQGAAVSYRAIEQQFWGGCAPEKLNMLLTYGSGVRKLFDLEHLQHSRRLWVILGVSLVILSVIVGAMFLLFLGGVIPWWAPLSGLLVSVAFQFIPLAFSRILEDPTPLGIRWFDCYSTHDPVPNGSIELVEDREVVNRGSILSDHTSYWSSRDDFVATVATFLLERSDMRIDGTLDEEWLKVSKARRRWRVTWLSRCRAVTGLIGLSILFWPRDVLEPVGRHVRLSAATALSRLPEQFAAWVPGVPVPDWLVGAGGLLLGTYLMFLVALLGWTVWERQELSRFFRREPHSSAGLGGWIFALGWAAVLASAPAYVLAQGHLHWEDFLGMLWAPSMLAGWSAWRVNKSGCGPGTPPEWARIELARAEESLADEKQDRDALREARVCFERVQKYLRARYSGSDEWVRAVIGETQAVEELAKYNLLIRDLAPAVYQEAIDALKRAGRDASEVQSRFEKAKAEANI
jgi:hypothetical protein